MKLSASDAKLLRAAGQRRTRAELKRLFELVRANGDRVLLAAALPEKKKAPATPKGDPLVRELETALKPIMAPAAEKAELLIEHIAKKHRRKLNIEPKGLADATRQLRTRFTDEQIRAGARSLMTHMAKLYGDRETVV